MKYVFHFYFLLVFAEDRQEAESNAISRRLNAQLGSRLETLRRQQPVQFQQRSAPQGLSVILKFKAL